MTDGVLAEYVKQYITSHGARCLCVAGGEPTLLGIEFFQRVLELQARYYPRMVENAQTNGIC